jgi:uncharacterized MAPEG superfamily protein
MEVIVDILTQSFIRSGWHACMLAWLLFFLPVMLLATARVRAGRTVNLRPLAGFDTLRGLSARAAESGQTLHVSAGVSGISGGETAATLAGLTVLDYLAGQGATFDAPPIVTVADPTLLPMAQDVLRHAYARQGDVENYDPKQVRLISPEPTAYAAGVMDVLGHEPLAANIMIGNFGDEYLLMGEVGAQKDIDQIGGATNPQTLPFVFASTDQALIGEEIFAGGAYLASLPAHIGSLVAQDVMRLLCAVITVFLVLAKLVGLV